MLFDLTPYAKVLSDEWRVEEDELRDSLSPVRLPAGNNLDSRRCSRHSVRRPTFGWISRVSKLEKQPSATRFHFLTGPIAGL